MGNTCVSKEVTSNEEERNVEPHNQSTKPSQKHGFNPVDETASHQDELDKVTEKNTEKNTTNQKDDHTLNKDVMKNKSTVVTSTKAGHSYKSNRDSTQLTINDSTARSDHMNFHEQKPFDHCFMKLFSNLPSRSISSFDQLATDFSSIPDDYEIHPLERCECIDNVHKMDCIILPKLLNRGVLMFRVGTVAIYSLRSMYASKTVEVIHGICVIFKEVPDFDISDIESNLNTTVDMAFEVAVKMFKKSQLKKQKKYNNVNGKLNVISQLEMAREEIQLHLSVVSPKPKKIQRCGSRFVTGADSGFITHHDSKFISNSSTTDDDQDDNTDIQIAPQETENAKDITTLSNNDQTIDVTQDLESEDERMHNDNLTTKSHTLSSVVGLCPAYFVAEELEEDEIFLVLPYCENGPISIWDPQSHTFSNVFQKKKKYCETQDENNESSPIFDEKLAAYFLRQCILGLITLHRNGLAHRDVKPGNILISRNYHACIADYGISKKFWDNLENDNYFANSYSLEYSQIDETDDDNISTTITDKKNTLATMNENDGDVVDATESHLEGDSKNKENNTTAGVQPIITFDRVEADKSATTFQDHIAKGVQQTSYINTFHPKLKVVFSDLGAPLIYETEGTYEFFAPEMCMSSKSSEAPNNASQQSHASNIPASQSDHITSVPYDPFKADLWALGITLYSILMGRLPFFVPPTDIAAGNDLELFNMISTKQVSFAAADAADGHQDDETKKKDVIISRNAQDLILRLLDKDPNSRITLLECLTHPFLDNAHTLPKCYHR